MILYDKDRQGAANVSRNDTRLGFAGLEERQSKGTDGSIWNALHEELDGVAIVFPRFLCEAEERKEYESTHDTEPTRKLYRSFLDGNGAPKDGRVKVDVRKVQVCISPSLPRLDSSDTVDDESEGTKNESNKADDCGKTYKTEVSIISEAGSGQELVELLAAIVECPNAHDTVKSGDTSNQDGWARHKDESNRGIVDRRETPNVLENVEAVALWNVLQNDTQNGKSNAYGEVNHDSLAPFSSRYHDISDGRNSVEAPGYTEGSSRDCDIDTDVNSSTDIAPNRCPIDHITVPDDGVYE